MRNNKLIAEFMGYRVDEGMGIIFKDNSPQGNLNIFSQWNGIMSVVEKIESLGYWVRMDFGDVYIVNDDSDIIIENPTHKDKYTKLTLVYEVVVNFIKWYNETQKPQTPKKYSHAMDIGFEVESDSMNPTNEEILEGLEKRMKTLRETPEEIQVATGLFDTIDRENNK